MPVFFVCPIWSCLSGLEQPFATTRQAALRGTSANPYEIVVHIVDISRFRIVSPGVEYQTIWYEFIGSRRREAHYWPFPGAVMLDLEGFRHRRAAPKG